MFRKIRDIRAVMKILGYWDKIRKEVDSVDSKNVLYSKTLWFNVASIAVTAGELLPVKYAVPTMAIGNVILRLLTSQPVNILPTPKP